ncbi:hypothetical protein GCM10009872_29680 [Actinopolymorpha rutila]
MVGPARLGTFPLRGIGRVLTDTHGRTVYVDSEPPNAEEPRCAAVCTNIWHPVTVGSAEVRSEAKGVLVRFGTLPLPRQGGLHQLTVDGRRLYTFVPDVRPGQTRGQGFRTGDQAGLVYTWSAVVVPASAPTSIPLRP